MAKGNSKRARKQGQNDSGQPPRPFLDSNLSESKLGQHEQAQQTPAGEQQETSSEKGTNVLLQNTHTNAPPTDTNLGVDDHTRPAENDAHLGANLDTGLPGAYPTTEEKLVPTTPLSYTSAATHEKQDIPVPVSPTHTSTSHEGSNASSGFSADPLLTPQTSVHGSDMGDDSHKDGANTQKNDIAIHIHISDAQDESTQRDTAKIFPPPNSAPNPQQSDTKFASSAAPDRVTTPLQIPVRRSISNTSPRSPAILSYAAQIEEMRRVIASMGQLSTALENQTACLKDRIPAAQAAEEVDNLKTQVDEQIKVQETEADNLKTKLKAEIGQGLTERLLAKVQERMRLSFQPLLQTLVKQKVEERLKNMPELQDANHDAQEQEIKVELENNEARRKNALINRGSPSVLHFVAPPSPNATTPSIFPPSLEDLFNLSKEHALKLATAYSGSSTAVYAQLPREALVNLVMHHLGVTYQLQKSRDDSAPDTRIRVGAPRKLVGPLVTRKF